MSNLPATLKDVQDKFVDKRRVKGVYARLKDGQLVECEVDEYGNLIPVSLIQEHQQLQRQGAVIDQEIPPEDYKSITEEINETMANPSPEPMEESEEMEDTLAEYREAMENGLAGDPRSGKSAGSHRKKGMSIRTLLHGDVPDDSDVKKAAEIIEEEMKQNAENPYLRKELHEDGLRDPAFRARIQSIMTDNKYDRRVRNRKRGKLDMKRLWKVSTGSESVFMKKEARKGKMYNVVLIVDESGSMSGRDVRLAAESALYLNEAFKGANINLAILGFNHFLVLHKDFNEVVEDKAGMWASMVGRADSHGAGCNHDYDALNKGYQMLEEQRMKNGGEGVLMLLCDGSPAGCGGDAHLYPPSPLSRLDKHQKDHFHALARRYKDHVASVGIGIRVEAWQVPDNVTINSTSDLNKTLVGLLRKKITRG